MSRLATKHKVYFVEEPVFDNAGESYFNVHKDEEWGVYVLTPHLPIGLADADVVEALNLLLNSIVQFLKIDRYIVWHYSPMSYAFSRDLCPVYRVYDCMDELANFLFAPAALKENETALLRAADIVFTGGYSLYRAKKAAHHNIYCFPSSIDKDHFGKARHLRSGEGPGPADQIDIAGPRIGFFGVIDERLDIAMLRMIAELRPAWQYILIGPVVKIDAAILPRLTNIHYLGSKRYADLPDYLAGWDIAMMPFALNASTEFISPTKTPEYLAGGVPVIAPSIRDVVTPYFDLGLVSIANTAAEFVRAAELILGGDISREWLTKVDNFLADMSWDNTVSDMKALIEGGITEKITLSTRNTTSYV